jgi:hypothetical protein
VLQRQRNLYQDTHIPDSWKKEFEEKAARDREAQRGGPPLAPCNAYSAAPHALAEIGRGRSVLGCHVRAPRTGKQTCLGACVRVWGYSGGGGCASEAGRPGGCAIIRACSQLSPRRWADGRGWRYWDRTNVEP